MKKQHKRVLMLTVTLLSLTSSLALAVDLKLIDEYVQQEMQKALIPGLAYAIVEDGQFVHMNAFGVAGRDGQPMTTDTILNTASVGKTFTALAIRQLINAGKIDPDAPVQRYLPWFSLADAEAARGITVQHLLTHTSGLSTRDGNRLWLHQPGPTGEELVRRMAGLGTNRPVGSSWEYSNLNYLILGQVVEAVSGQSYEQYLQENIFDRLGMTQSFFSRDAARVAGLPVSAEYRLLFGFPVATEVPTPRGAMAEGQHFTTVEDMARYLIAFSNRGRYEGLSVVTPDGAPTADFRNYSMAWEPEGISDPYYGTGFSGGWLTYSAGIEVLPNQRFGVVVLANANTSQAFGTKSSFDIAFDIMRLYHGWSLSPPRTSVRAYYLVADTVLLALALAVILHAARLRGWRERVLRSKYRRLAHLPWVVVDLVLPLALLIVIPAWVTRMPTPWEGWERFIFSVPDLGYAQLILLLALLAIGLVKLALLASRPLRTRDHEPLPSARGAPAH